MTPQNCTSEEAITAVQYLRYTWGGYAIPELEDRALVRMFGEYPKAEITRAIDELRRKQPERRPGPSEITAHIQERRRAAGTPEEALLLEQRRLAWAAEHPGEPLPWLGDFRDETRFPDTRNAEPEAHGSPESVKRHLDAIRAANPAITRSPRKVHA